jgi:hypothetical protein
LSITGKVGLSQPDQSGCWLLEKARGPDLIHWIWSLAASHSPRLTDLHRNNFRGSGVLQDQLLGSMDPKDNHTSMWFRSMAGTR